MLRDYQEKTCGETDEAVAAGYRGILVTTATGGGKSKMIAHRCLKAQRPMVIQAHRQELVYQLSMALAEDGIEHRILSPSNVSNFIVEKQWEIFGKSLINPKALHTVAGVDTVIARSDDLGNWAKQVEEVQTDEGHHALLTNKWGRSLTAFPNARNVAWTATAMRPDRKSLRRGEGLTGVYDKLIIGPSTRELLARGYLTPFKIFGPKPSIDTAGLLIGESGEYAPAELARRAHKSTIVGDMLEHYQKLAPGRVGIGFAVDVEQAKEFAARFQAAGIPCEWMSSRETDDRKRVRTMEALRSGAIKLIFNVDLLGEGVDVPRVEVVLDGRPTASLVRYLQVFGRLLRLFAGKTEGIYIDMVGNVMRHGKPDREHVWSLDVAAKRKQLPNDEEALAACPCCFKHREQWIKECPHCDNKPCGHCGEPMQRDLDVCPSCKQAVVRRAPASRPDQVDGDLTEYSDELLGRLAAEAANIIGPAPRGKVPAYVERNWNVRAVAQVALREAINWWCSTQSQRKGIDTPSIYRLFWHRFGIDTATAQMLSGTQAIELKEKLWEDINNICSHPKMGGVLPLVPVEDFKRRRSPNGEQKIHRACIQIKGHKMNLGFYETRDEADQVEENKRKELGLPLKRSKLPNGEQKQFRGVFRWAGKQVHVGWFHTKIEADDAVALKRNELKSKNDYKYADPNDNEYDKWVLGLKKPTKPYSYTSPD